ncbi:MAG TPA: hypothetical protein VFD70_12350 [Anaerolineae bacterium]|nr:hypothetical protein [Anaerolineae bacterium]
MARILIACCLLLLALGVVNCAPAPAANNTPAPGTALVAPPTSAAPLLAPGQESIPDVGLEQAIPLTGDWRYKRVQLFNPEMAQPQFDDSQWTITHAPAPWQSQGLEQYIGQPTIMAYRRQVEIPGEWRGKPIGISAWFNPYLSQVFVNGEKVEPARKPFAPYGDVSSLLRYGENNTVAVTTLYDGVLEQAEAGPARIGPITTRSVTRVLHEDVAIPTGDKNADATVIRPAEKQNLPTLVLIATGSHGLAEKQTWFDFAEDLARQGYVSLALALPEQTSAGVIAALHYLRSQAFVDPERIVLFGADQGAQTAVLAAAQDPQIRGLILLSAQSRDEVSQLGSRPVLLLASEKDRQGYFVEQAQALAPKIPGAHELVILPGSSHGTAVFTDAWNATRQAVVGWMRKLN